MSFAFDNLHDFIAMGHHGIYVWSAWFITLFATIFLVIQSRFVRQQFFREEVLQARLQKARVDRLKQESLR